MNPTRRPAFLPMMLAMAYVVLVVSLELVHVGALQDSAGRAVGFQLADVPAPAEDTTTGAAAPSPRGLPVVGITDDGPADRAGLEVGDVILSVAGHKIDSWKTYQKVSGSFLRGVSVPFEVQRGDARRTLSVSPGVAPKWGQFILSVLVVLACLTLGLLALYQKGSDLRARLVAAFSFLLAIELALPLETIGDDRLNTLSHSLFLLVTGVQMAVELHLAAVVPSLHPWIRGRRSWIVPTFYMVGLGAGVAAWASYLIEDRDDPGLALPWTYVQADTLLFQLLMPIWAVAVAVLLGAAAFGHKEPIQRTQAGLILLGVLPWTLYVLIGTFSSWLGFGGSQWLDPFFPLIVAGFPIAVAVSIYRYELFDIELVVRRSFLYTALTASMIAAFYLSVATFGLLFSKVTGDANLSIWTVSLAMFLVGVAFNPIRLYLERVIDRALFPDHQALRRRLAELAAELPAQGNVTAMGQHLVQRLREIYSLQAASLLLSDPKSGLFFTVASTNAQADRDLFSLSFLVKPDDPVMRRLAEVGHPLPAARLLEGSPVLARRLKPLEAQLMVPLRSHSSLVGVLVLGRRQGRARFSREDRDLLSLIGHQIATAFENIRLFESATFESLTGLRRREAILDLLATEIERARRYGRPLVVGMADLDFFKAVNDRFGHLAGDAVLKRVAEVLTSGLRATDVVGRYGGEEFLLVFPETHLDGGTAVAEKLRRLVEELSLPMEDGSTVQPRISIGLAELEDVGGDGDLQRRLIDFADQALYRAKAAGRNRVMAYGTATDELTGGLPA